MRAIALTSILTLHVTQILKLSLTLYRTRKPDLTATATTSTTVRSYYSPDGGCSPCASDCAEPSPHPNPIPTLTLTLCKALTITIILTHYNSPILLLTGWRVQSLCERLRAGNVDQYFRIFLSEFYRVGSGGGDGGGEIMCGVGTNGTKRVVNLCCRVVR